MLLLMMIHEAGIPFSFHVSVQELEREKHAHGILQFQFNELKQTLKQSEELLTVSLKTS